MKLISRMLILLSASLALTAPGQSAFAQDYPTRPIRLVVPFPAGGGVDAVARILAEKMTTELGQAVVVDNRGGAGGSLATSLVKNAAPDGYTLLLTTNGHTILPTIQKTDWDPIKDFTPIAQVVAVHFMVLVNANSPITSFKQLVATAKSQPGKLSYASSGIGGTLHLGMEMVKSAAAIDMLHVPYKGNAQMTTALLGGEVNVSMDTLAVSLPQVRQGKFRGLAVTSSKRLQLVPDIPTISEAGYPGFEYAGWDAILAPAGTPPAIVTRVHAALVNALATPAVRQRLSDVGFEPKISTPAEMAALIASDLQKHRKVVRDANIKAE
jgi:tripartite-type tricarboxylate transporter receptor subunit TctC